MLVNLKCFLYCVFNIFINEIDSYQTFELNDFASVLQQGLMEEIIRLYDLYDSNFQSLNTKKIVII